MTAPDIGVESHREDLTQAIVNELRSWPEPHADVFKQSHYQGRSARDVAHSLGISVQEVNEILEGCELKLRSALAVFRDTQTEFRQDSVHRLSLCSY